MGSASAVRRAIEPASAPLTASRTAQEAVPCCHAGSVPARNPAACSRVYGDGTVETHVYSASGQRRRKITAAGTTHFVWDGVNVLQEADAAYATAAQYTDNPGFWGRLASQRRSNASVFYAFDPQGNLYILDDGNEEIKRVDTNGILTIYAGGGDPPGGNNEGLPATSAKPIVDLPTGCSPLE